MGISGYGASEVGEEEEWFRIICFVDLFDVVLLLRRTGVPGGTGLPLGLALDALWGAGGGERVADRVAYGGGVVRFEIRGCAQCR